MAKNRKIEIRTTCKVCGEPLGKRFRTFCSTKCRQFATNLRYRDYQKKWNRKKRAEYSPDKKKCAICGGWYVQVGSHIVSRHKMTAREYREEFNLPVKRGIVPAWYRKIKGETALENKTYLNLEKGKPKRFERGDERAKKTTFWKGKRYPPDDYYE